MTTLFILVIIVLLAVLIIKDQVPVWAVARVTRRKQRRSG
jgi:hypothetical protein